MNTFLLKIYYISSKSSDILLYNNPNFSVCIYFFVFVSLSTPPPPIFFHCTILVKLLCSLFIFVLIFLIFCLHLS